MTKARDLANIISGGFTVDDLPTLTESQIPNLSASKITSGTFADARIAASNVNQHASSFDDNSIVNDISTLGLRVHSQENLTKSATNSQFVDVFQDGTGISATTTSARHAEEYVSSAVESADSATVFSYTGSEQTYTPSGKSKFDAYIWGAAGGAGYFYSSGGGGGRYTSSTSGAGGFASGTIAISGSPTYKMIVGQGGFATDVVNTYSGASAYGGGGRGYVQSHYGTGGGGGGLSGIFLTSYAHGNSLLIAGGGAGSPGSDPATGAHAGNGGGTTGQDGGVNSSSGHNADGNGKGGTQSAGGADGVGDYSTDTAGSALQGGDGGHMCGGGGGGYYGGGGANHTNSHSSSGAGGGSGYAHNSLVTNAVLTGITDTTLAGTKAPPQTGSSHYASGIGQGNNGAHGGNGRIVIVPYSLATNATGNFISSAITASASTNKIGAVITYQDHAGTNALNTDIILQLSADNGSNFTTATLTALPDFATGIKMCKVNDLTIGTAGTQIKYKILFANQSASKLARIRGVSLQY